MQRYRALIEMLRRRELEAYGIGGKSGTLDIFRIYLVP